MRLKNRKIIMSQKRKKKFKVEPGQDITEVLKQMKEEGYQVTRRIEVPVFKEEDGQIVVSHQEIIFEGKLIKE